MSWISGMINDLYSLRERLLNMDESGIANKRPTTAVEEETNYNDFRAVDLKNIAKKRGLKGYSRLNKADLIEFLQKNSS